MKTAKEGVTNLGLEVLFLRADVIDLRSISKVKFDVVYTGGPISVEISAIGKYYGGAVGVLGTRGLFIVNDNLPIRRMWHESNGPTPRHRYFDRGLYKYQRDEGPVVGNPITTLDIGFQM